VNPMPHRSAPLDPVHGRKSGASRRPVSALVRYLWPFWLFQDASRGDLYARAAAYRHNVAMRVYLPGYLLKWLVGSALTLGIARQLAALSVSQITGAPDFFIVMAAAIGMLFASEMCLLVLTAYIYFYLSRHLY
jgi:hypothetical protein